MKHLKSIVELERISATPAQDILFQEVDGEVVLLSLKTGEYFGLNSVGARVWTMLNRKHTWPEIIADLKQLYGVSDEQLIGDIAGFLDELGGSGLIKVASTAQ